MPNSIAARIAAGLRIRRRDVSALAALPAALAPAAADAARKGRAEGGRVDGGPETARKRYTPRTLVTRAVDDAMTLDTLSQKLSTVSVCARRRDGDLPPGQCDAEAVSVVPATSHVLELAGLAADQIYDLSVTVRERRGGAARQEGADTGRKRYKPAYEDIPTRSAPVADPEDPPLGFRTEPVAIVDGVRVGVRWSTTDYANAWADFAPFAANGTVDWERRKQRFELFTLSGVEIRDLITGLHQICLETLEPEREYRWSATSARGREQIARDELRFRTGRPGGAGGALEEVGVTELDIDAAGVIALPDGRLLAFSGEATGPVRVLEEQAAGFRRVAGWDSGAPVAGAAAHPSGAVLLLQDGPALPDGGPTSALTAWRVEGEGAVPVALDGFVPAAGEPLSLLCSVDGLVNLVAVTGATGTLPTMTQYTYAALGESGSESILVFDLGSRPTIAVQTLLSPGGMVAVRYWSAAVGVSWLDGALLTFWNGETTAVVDVATGEIVDEADGEPTWTRMRCIAPGNGETLWLVDDCLGRLIQFAADPATGDLTVLGVTFSEYAYPSGNAQRRLTEASLIAELPSGRVALLGEERSTSRIVSYEPVSRRQ